MSTRLAFTDNGCMVDGTTIYKTVTSASPAPQPPSAYQGGGNLLPLIVDLAADECSRFSGSAGTGFTPHVITVVAGEGRFEILSLSGSFLLSESGGRRSRTGGLSVSLAGPYGRVLGGVAGLLLAASPVQVIVGSFSPYQKKESQLRNQADPVSSVEKLATGRTAGGESSCVHCSSLPRTTSV